MHSDLISSGFVPCGSFFTCLLACFHWDFAWGLLSIPEDKISVFLASIREVLVSYSYCKLCWLRSKIICMLVFGDMLEHL